jgi:hypothetical protein
MLEDMIISLFAVLFRRKEYSEGDLVSFGNYVLSINRKKGMVHNHLEEEVTDSDLNKWKDIDQKT